MMSCRGEIITKAGGKKGRETEAGGGGGGLKVVIMAEISVQKKNVSKENLKIMSSVFLTLKEIKKNKFMKFCQKYHREGIMIKEY